MLKKQLFAVLISISVFPYTTSMTQFSGICTQTDFHLGSQCGVRTAWVRHYVSGLPGYDVATALAVDDSGNVYVTGYSSNLALGMDYFTVKYSSAGDPVWTARYHGELSGYNFASALYVDASGNVYVAGTSEGSGTGSDYATVKYDRDGVEQWVARYNGPGNRDDEAIALVVDASGNVYVTGRSLGSDIGRDYVTVKYDRDGVEQWVARYNGPGNRDDEATALAVDASGNVYVTGASEGSGTSYDYATIRYNSHGFKQWVARYSHYGRGLDEATALTIDEFGNVYVTGRSRGSGTWDDYATVKYNSDGAQEWVTRYNGPGSRDDKATALAVDASGNVYVTGGSASSSTYPYDFDYATIKYNPDGAEEWVACYNGPEDWGDKATAVAVDGSGNIYVTGKSSCSGDYPYNYDYATVKYNSDGVREWVVHYNGSGNSSDEATGLALDASGNVYVTGWSEGAGTDRDYTTVKYDSDGVEQWGARYDGPGRNDWDEATGLAIDTSGSVYVTGTSGGSGTDRDYATVKYNPSGAEQWVARYSGPGNSLDKATALAIDDSGNIYVAGNSGDSGTGIDYATVKYNSEGVEEWVARYNGPGNSSDEATALAVDAAGNVYVTGGSPSSSTYPYNFDYATVKYNSEGVEEWVARYTGSKDSSDYATALAIDAHGNVYVTGYSKSSSTKYDYATIKYNSEGIEEWVARYNGPGNSLDKATALAIDASGNVYVTGVSVGTATPSDYATIKYNSAGAEQWVTRYNGPGNSYDQANALAVDASGNVYVTGGSGFYQELDYATVKYNPDGIKQWVVHYNGSGNSVDGAVALTLDGSDNVYITGTSVDSITGEDYVTVKYNSNGIQQWVARYNGPGNSSDKAVSLAVDAQGNVYVTGGSGRSDLAMCSTIKYAQIPVSVGLMGDVNNDGIIDILDVVTAVRHILGIQILVGDALYRTDCNGDGQINALDVLGIVDVILDFGECEH